MESNHLPLGYEPNEIPLLQPAIILFKHSIWWVDWDSNPEGVIKSHEF